MAHRNIGRITASLPGSSNGRNVLVLAIALLIVCAATSWVVSSISNALNQPAAASTSAAAQNLLPDEFATRLANSQNQPPSQVESSQPNASFSLENISMVVDLLAGIVAIVGGMYAGYRVLRRRK